MKDLILNVKTQYFNEIKSGAKTREYRVRGHYWDRRLQGKVFRNVVIRLGYPKAGDSEREIVFPFNGWHHDVITHPLFGRHPVEVYAIILDHRDSRLMVAR
jgi:hypothetical protein